jgi:hypothetical protein
MEVPIQLKQLYRHWEKHTLPVKTPTAVSVDHHLLAQIEQFIAERMQVWEKRQQHQPAPWTKDPLLQSYRFCNIYRELDRQTIEYHQLLNPLRDNFPLWLLNMFFARMVCRPETLLQTGLLSFDPQQNQQVYQKLLALPRPRYGTAYIFPISTIMSSPFPTREQFICSFLPQIMPKIAGIIENFRLLDVYGALDLITPVYGFNHRFLWTEILIDTAYQFPHLINLFGRFPFGPGSLPTLKKLNSQATPEDVCLALLNFQPKQFPYLQFNGQPVLLSAENWEGIGCEFRKYSHLQAGHGRKRIFSSSRKKSLPLED